MQRKRAIEAVNQKHLEALSEAEREEEHKKMVQQAIDKLHFLKNNFSQL